MVLLEMRDTTLEICNGGKSINHKSADNDLPPVIWNKKVCDTHLEKLKKIIEKKYEQHFENYWDLHKWSIRNFPEFWEEVWKYLRVISSTTYEEVYRKTGNGLLNCEWFIGAEMNYAENLLRFRDDKVALICGDETDQVETVTYAEMYEEVKLYAAAFKKHGLKKNDRVACCMSNRKEAVFAFLAAVSMGAIFTGPNPFFGLKPTTNIIQRMTPKFLICIDQHTEDYDVYSTIDMLEHIAKNTPSLEKIIIVATHRDTLSRNISVIKNSCFLEDFLNSGRNSDGIVPDLEFAQLPFDHPVVVNFTSGTTGMPKAPVHSAGGTLLSVLSSLVLYWDLKRSDVIFASCPVGWTLWDFLIPCLSWGSTLFLYAGNPWCERKDSNMCYLFTKHGVTSTFLGTAGVEEMEQMNEIAGLKAHLNNLRYVAIGGSPVRSRHQNFIRNKVKKDTFVCIEYGSSEVFGIFNGIDFSLPVYAGEVQVPALGLDIRCVDKEGNSVVDERGEMVIVSPSPAYPIYLWNDEDGGILRENYLTKYPGAWCQNDEMMINSKTNGMIIFGRSDDALMQNGAILLPSDIYDSIHDIEEIQDCICVSQRNDSGACRSVLFIKMKNGHLFTSEFKEKVVASISENLCEENVPELILETHEIPYNYNNKKVESAIRKILQTNTVSKVNNIKNPECLKYYVDIPDIVSYNKK